VAFGILFGTRPVVFRLGARRAARVDPLADVWDEIVVPMLRLVHLPRATSVIL
jgi:hypothetical protein